MLHASEHTVALAFERGLAQAATTAMILLCYACPRPEDFWVPVAGSVCAVCTASAVLLVTMALPPHGHLAQHQKKGQ